jgi:hypothetical protein
MPLGDETNAAGADPVLRSLRFREAELADPSRLLGQRPADVDPAEASLREIADGKDPTFAPARRREILTTESTEKLGYLSQ